MTPSSDGSTATGVLYVVATPIGNLGDISTRATQLLSEVDLVAAEDTRHSAQLLSALGIDNRLISFHDHSSGARLESILTRLRSGESVALISDAGTPAISDPGFELVRSARRESIPVLTVPGPSALIAALSISGIASDRFVFEGFLPARAGQRQARLDALRTEERTILFYESPHRIVAMLQDLADAFGSDRPLFVGRELTKKFETGLSGSIAECLNSINGDRNQQKGEFVLVLAGRPAGESEKQRLEEGLRILTLLLEELPLNKASRLAARISGAPRNRLYEAGLATSTDARR